MKLRDRRSFMFSWLLLTFYLICSGQPTPRSNDESPAETTLCKIVAHSQRFDGRRVRFHASFVGDGIEHAVLVSSGCKLGIVPYLPTSEKLPNDLDAFERAIYVSKPGTIDKRITAVFTGVFRWKPPKGRTLDVEQIAELRVTPVQNK
jgi:hypothetical protein